MLFDARKQLMKTRLNFIIQHEDSVFFKCARDKYLFSENKDSFCTVERKKC